MDGMISGAGALSTYGLYFVVAILGYVSWRLYQRTTRLEGEFRQYLAQKSELYGKALSDSTLMLSEARDALNRVAAVMEKMQ